MNSTRAAIRRHQSKLRQCRKCPDMFGPVVVGQPVISPVMLIGQAPGSKEIEVGRPFAWTAGKTLFKWFAQIGLNETQFRDKVYMAAVCRCFPGKKPRGGDRVPSLQEVANCRVWLQDECELIRPRLLIPVGKLAIAQFLPVNRLAEVIGQVHEVDCFGDTVDCVPLPHPSGASTWHRTSPGRELLQDALRHIEDHSAWQTLLAG